MGRKKPEPQSSGQTEPERHISDNGAATSARTSTRGAELARRGTRPQRVAEREISPAEHKLECSGSFSSNSFKALLLLWGDSSARERKSDAGAAFTRRPRRPGGGWQEQRRDGCSGFLSPA
ncbi:unnamed protein product [Lampetra fluviatilis]